MHDYEKDMQLEAIKEPTFFINQFKDKAEFREWLMEGSRKDLECTLKAFENAELYEYCAMIKEMLTNKTL